MRGIGISHGVGSTLRRVILPGLLTCALAAVAVVSSATNSEARTYSEIKADVEAALKDPNCRSKESIDRLIQEANQIIDHMRHPTPNYTRARSTRGQFRNPFTERAGDDVVLERLASHLPEKICPPPPPPDPVKLYFIGEPPGRYKRQGEEERLEIGDARMGGPRIQTASFSGFYVGANIAGSFDTLGQTETLKMTNVVTNDFSDSSSGIGGGFEAGYLFAPWNNRIVVGPFASVEFPNQTTNHTFPGGFFLGQTTNVIGTVGAQVGVIAAPGVMFYGELGVAFAGLDQKLNFSGPVTSASQTVTGANLGIGVAFQPTNWQVGRIPVAVAVQYNRIILPSATFDNAGSPGFAYRNDNATNKFLVGLRFNIAASPPPPPPR
jgi:opacity protein-like surface antigen